ncbi:MAG TPA: ABC transporter substrate-binding protein [Anaerolineales bacterium]|nr:ABC transporter substrate-binding protein [Anaerolineales bacterium]
MAGSPPRKCRSSIACFHTVMLVLLIGCTTAQAATPTPRASAPTATEVLETPTSTPPQETPTSVPPPTSSPFVPKAVIKIASHGPLSGNQAIFGTDMLRGAQLAVTQLAGPLAEKGYKLELVSYNDGNNLDTAAANTIETIADREILCSVGHLTARITVPMSELYHQAGLALIAPFTTTPNLTDRRYREINRMIGRDDRQGIAGAMFAKDQGINNVYIVSERDQYGLKNAEYFRLQADSTNIQVLGMVVIGRNDTVEKVVPRVLVSNPELIYFAGRVDQALLFFKEARAAGFTGTFLGIDDLNNPALIESAGPSLLEGGGMYFTILTPPAILYPVAAEFIEIFELYYNSSPLLFAARAYDAVGMCIKAIENASNAKGGAVPTREDVVNAIRLLKDYEGITGTYTFNRQGDKTLMQYYVFEVTSSDPAEWDQDNIVASYDVTPP